MEVAGREPAGLDADFLAWRPGRSPACRAPAGRRGAGTEGACVCIDSRPYKAAGFGVPEQARTETPRRLPRHLRGQLERDPRRSLVTGRRVDNANQRLTGGVVGHVGADPLGEEG